MRLRFAAINTDANQQEDDSKEDSMNYQVALHQSEEGFSIWVPGLPGCCSQGTTEEEALANIADAIREYLEARAELLQGVEIREVEVSL